VPKSVSRPEVALFGIVQHEPAQPKATQPESSQPVRIQPLESRAKRSNKDNLKPDKGTARAMRAISIQHDKKAGNHPNVIKEAVIQIFHKLELAPPNDLDHFLGFLLNHLESLLTGQSELSLEQAVADLLKDKNNPRTVSSSLIHQTNQNKVVMPSETDIKQPTRIQLPNV
jgi:hypothetical protein